MKYSLWISLALTLTMVSPAQATSRKFKKKKKVATVLTAPADIVVPVPQTQFILSSAKPPAEPITGQAWEVSASTWTPQNLQEPSLVSNTTQFTSGSAPQMSLNYISTKFQDVTQVKLAPKFGLSFMQVERDGNINLVDQQIPVHQTMNLYSLRVGLEVATASHLRGIFEPFFDASIIPTYAQASSSSFSAGINHLDTAAEGQLGCVVHLPTVAHWLTTEDFGLQAGVISTLGLFGTSYSGYGFSGGLRVAL